MRSGEVSRALVAEWFKVRRQRMAVVIPILLAVFVVLTYFVTEFAARRDWIGVPSGYYIAATVFSLLVSLMTLVALVVTAGLLGQEFSLGTVRGALVSPVRRERWFVSKALIAAMLVAGLLVGTAALTALLALSRLGFEDLYENQYLVHTSGALAVRFVLTVALTLWSLFAAVSLVATLSTLTNSSGQAIAAGAVATIALMALGAIPVLRPFLLSTYIVLPADQMVAMAKGLPLPLEWGTLVWRTLAGGAGWMLLSLAVGIRIIERKEIHG